MTRMRIAASAVALLALLTACGGSGSSSTPTTPSAADPSSSSASATDTPTATPDDSSSSPAANPSGLPGSLVALQLCGTTLGYAAGAVAGVPADQLSKLEVGVASAQNQAGPAEAELLAASKAVVDAVKGGDQQAIASAARTMGDVCGAGG